MKARILTPVQETVLRALFDGGLGEMGYYLTGGTALSEFYLQHRYSDDLDLFTRESRNLREDFDLCRSVFESLNLTVSNLHISDQHISAFLESGSAQSTKIDLAKDVPAQMAPPLIDSGLAVDSFEDISVNKACTILSRTEIKDFCDLYFILKESQFTIDYLMERAKEKDAAFESDEGNLMFAVNLLEVRNLDFLPRMIKPLSKIDLQNLLVPLATALILRMRPDKG